MNKFIPAFILLATTSAFAQQSSVHAPMNQSPAKMELTMAQIVALDAGMKALDAGSTAQCGQQKPAATTACPYHKTTDLIITIAENTLVLQGPIQALQKEQGDLRTQIVNDPKKNDAQKGAAWGDGQQKLSDQKVTVYGLRQVPLDLLNLGTAPEKNEIPGAVVAQLAPMISGLTVTK